MPSSPVRKEEKNIDEELEHSDNTKLGPFQSGSVPGVAPAVFNLKHSGNNFTFGEGANVTTVSGDQIISNTNCNNTHTTTVNKQSADSATPVDKSWEKMAGEVKLNDDERIRAWKSDLDTLLIVAGIMSVSLTLFTIESYRWLSEDPAATMVIILNQISQQISDRNSPLQPIPPLFHPSASVIRINCLWFLSLIMSLTCSAVGILCRQWLHEHSKYTHTKNPAEGLALQRLRFESLHHWGVPGALSFISLFLGIALLLFFAGLLEAFWLRNPVLFAIGAAAIGLIYTLYITTVLLPALRIVFAVLTISTDALNDNPFSILNHLPSLQYRCPYKTPLAWVAFLYTRAVLSIPLVKQLLYRLSRSSNFGMFQDRLDGYLRAISDWDSLDLGVLRMFHQISPRAPSVYELQGIQWLLKTYGDTPSLVPHLETILRFDLSLGAATLVTFSALDQWKLFAWIKLEMLNDVNLVLKDSITFFREGRRMAGLDPEGRDSISGSSMFESPLCTQILYYFASWSDDTIDWKPLYELTHTLYKMNIPLHAKIPFVLPFYEVEKLWSLHGGQRLFSGESSSHIFERKLGLEFLEFYRTGWNIASQLDAGHYDKLALVTALTNHIRKHSQTSTLVTTEEGLNFLSFIHDRIITEELYQNGDWTFTNIIPNWLSALDAVPSDRPNYSFKQIPGFFPLTLSRLLGLLKNSEATPLALVAMLDSFKQSWDEVGQRQRQGLVKALSEHINSQPTARPILLLQAGDSDRGSPNPGIDFLTFVNNKLVKDPAFHRGDVGDIRSRWVKALGRIRYAHRLPSDYFRPLPTPGTTVARIGTESATDSRGDEDEQIFEESREDQGDAGGEGKETFQNVPAERPPRYDTGDVGLSRTGRSEHEEEKTSAHEGQETTSTGSKYERHSGFQETGDSVQIDTPSQHDRENENIVVGGLGADNNV